MVLPPIACREGGGKSEEVSLFTIHHLGLSQSERIIWLCEELGIPYDLKLYARSPMRAPAEYKALHPMGMAPVITEDDLTLGESGAIIEYIIAKYGDGRLALKPDHENFADYLYWFHFTNATLLPSVTSAMIAQMAGAPADGPLALAMNERANLSYQSMEERLSNHEYLAGEFTAADINIVFAVTTMRAFAARDLSTYPNILAYLQRIGSRPAYQRAMAKGDPGLTPMLN